MNNYSTHGKDVYQKVTDYVIEALEKGQVPWQQKWNALGLPRNITSGHIYRGWNVFFLNYVTMAKEFKTPYFLTFKQATALGGHIRKGEKGFPITYWAMVPRKRTLEKAGGDFNEPESEESAMRMVPKVHTIFNIDQTEGISYALPRVIEKSSMEKIESCEQIVAGMPDCPLIKHGGDYAYYTSLHDFVQMPPMEQFETPEDYYTTLFHELGHSTGHKKRLNRKDLVEKTVFGSPTYSKEELTAEFTAVYLSAISGIERKIIDNSAAYIQGWLRKLRGDKTLLLRASTQAQAAADFILNLAHQESTGVIASGYDVAA